MTCLSSIRFKKVALLTLLVELCLFDVGVYGSSCSARIIFGPQCEGRRSCGTVTKFADNFALSDAWVDLSRRRLEDPSPLSCF